MTRFQEKIYFRMWHQSKSQQPYISIIRLTSTITIKHFHACLHAQVSQVSPSYFSIRLGTPIRKIIGIS